MSKQMKHFLTLASLIVIGSFLAFLYGCIDGLALFAARIDPALEPWVFWVLLGAVCAMLGWFAVTALSRPRPIMVHADPSGEDLAAFRSELLNRLRKNPLLQDEEVVVNDESDLACALAVLREKADEEIRDAARRVFIGTAISQNGRLDVLVVLYLITRLNWRLAKLYNQRPHWREMLNLLANVSITAFVAGSIEDLGIEEHVTELMGPLVGGSAIGAVPGAQAIAGTITNSVLTGTTNCLLTLRCGIVARNYLSLDLDAKGSMRRRATLEASRVFVSMSAETVTYVTKALVRGTTGAVRSGSAKAVRSVGGTVSSTAEAVGNGARKAGDTSKETARTVGNAVKCAACAVGDTTRATARTVGRGARGAAGAVGSGAKSVGRAVKGAAGSVSRSVKTAASGTKETALTVLDKVKSVGRKSG